IEPRRAGAAGPDRRAVRPTAREAIEQRRRAARPSPEHLERDNPPRTAPMRIAIDIDSTLHHYWPLLSAAAKRRFGVDLPYDRQFTWAISRLRDERLRVCVAATPSPAAIVSAEPYPHAVETVNRWHGEG